MAEDAGDLAAFIRRETGLYLTEGEEYGVCGKSFIRMNPACPRERLMDGLERLEKGVELYRKKTQ